MLSGKFLVGVLTRESIQRAIEAGVTSETISKFLGANLHPKCGPSLPQNVVNQILNTIESNECTANITRLRLGCCATEESEMTLEIKATSEEFITRVVPKIVDTCSHHSCLFKPTDAPTEAARL